MKNWKTLSSRQVYSNPWIGVREDIVTRPDGSSGIYGVVEAKSHGVMIAPVDDENNIYLTLQERYTIGKESWELPAGGNDNEDFEVAARRELLEEVGLEAVTLEKVLSFNSIVGISDHTMHIYLATGLTHATDKLDPVDGILGVKKVPLEDAKSMILNGKIVDGISIAGILSVISFLERTRRGV